MINDSNTGLQARQGLKKGKNSAKWGQRELFHNLFKRWRRYCVFANTQSTVNFSPLIYTDLLYWIKIFNGQASIEAKECWETDAKNRTQCKNSAKNILVIWYMWIFSTPLESISRIDYQAGQIFLFMIFFPSHIQCGITNFLVKESASKLRYRFYPYA